MKKILAFAFSILTNIVFAQKPAVSLFNGKDFNGWHIDVPKLDNDPEGKNPFIIREGKLVSLAGVRQYPSRIKCALLGWHALMHAIAHNPQQGDSAAPVTPEEVAP